MGHLGEGARVRAAVFSEMALTIRLTCAGSPPRLANFFRSRTSSATASPCPATCPLAFQLQNLTNKLLVITYMGQDQVIQLVEWSCAVLVPS